jgi:hypothetical protein
VNRALALRIATCGLLGLGAALLISALLLSTYTVGKIAKIPLDIDATLVSEGTGTALNLGGLSTEHAPVDHHVPLVSQQQISVELPADADVVTLQVGSSVRRSDEQKDRGLLLAIVDTVTLDRSTAMAASDDAHPGGSVQKPRGVDDEKPPTPIALPHEGLSYRFPLHTKQESYPYFDPIAQQEFDADFDDEEDVNGMKTYRFTQNIGYDGRGNLHDPIRYPSLYAHDEDSEITAPASVWGVDSDDPDEDITMTRYYAAQKTFWVDPVSGTIVKSEEHANHYYARDPLEPEMTLANYTVTSNEETVESQVSAAHDQRDRLTLWSRVLPITFTATGLIALVAGGLLGWFGLRTESALIDPGLDTTAEPGFFDSLLSRLGRAKPSPEEPVSGAEAKTEKLPSQQPDSGSRPPRERPPGEAPPDEGPPNQP